MIITKDSHLDHAMTAAQLKHVLVSFATREGFFIETITLPEELGPVSCGLYGPIMGDSAISDDSVVYKRRGDRQYDSRMVPQLAHRKRQTYDVTVIAGPHDGKPCVLYTVFGGPLAPKEVNDPTLEESKRAEAIEFWSKHALAF